MKEGDADMTSSAFAGVLILLLDLLENGETQRAIDKIKEILRK